MIIELKKFGTTLISRQTGKEAFLAFQPALKNVKEDETLEVDFEGILTFSPSWGDEFLTPLLDKYGEKIILKNTSNPSVKATIEMLEESLNKKFNILPVQKTQEADKAKGGDQAAKPGDQGAEPKEAEVENEKAETKKEDKK